MIVPPGVLVMLLCVALSAVLKPDAVTASLVTVRTDTEAALTGARASLARWIPAVALVARQRLRDLAGGLAEGHSLLHKIVGLTALALVGLVVVTGDALMGAVSVCGMLRSRCTAIEDHFDVPLAIWFSVLCAAALWAMVVFDLLKVTGWIKWPKATWFRVASCVMFALSVLVLVTTGVFRKAMTFGSDMETARLTANAFFVGGAVLVVLTGALALVAIVWFTELLVIGLGSGFALVCLGAFWSATVLLNWMVGVLTGGFIHFVAIVRPAEREDGVRTMDPGAEVCRRRPPRLAVVGSAALAVLIVTLIAV